MVNLFRQQSATKRSDGQTSKDPVNRIAPGTLGAGLNPLILVAHL